MLPRVLFSSNVLWFCSLSFLFNFKFSIFKLGIKAIKQQKYFRMQAKGQSQMWWENLQTKRSMQKIPSGKPTQGGTYNFQRLEGSRSGWEHRHPCTTVCLSSVQFSRSVVSDSLQSHGLQHARPPCPSPKPGIYSNLGPLGRWCHPTISSSVISFSSHLQSSPAWGPFQMSQFFTSGGQSIGISASTSVFPMNIQDWFHLGWTGRISLLSKVHLRVFNTTVQKHQFFGIQSYL